MFCKQRASHVTRFLEPSLLFAVVARRKVDGFPHRKPRQWFIKKHAKQWSKRHDEKKANSRQRGIDVCCLGAEGKTHCTLQSVRFGTGQQRDGWDVLQMEP